MARIIGIVLLFLLAYPSQGSWLKDGQRQIFKKVELYYAQKTLPETFFRHAKWAPKVSADATDIERVTEFMSDEEFLQKFPPIAPERALDIYFVVGVTQYLFKKLDIKALPVGGTLLGILRNRGQLPHDDDADFAVLEASIDLIWKHEKEFQSYGLEIRDIPGIGIQIYPKGDHGTYGMAYTLVRNSFFDLVQRKTGWVMSHRDLTSRGFIDVMPIRFYEDVQAYRYSAPEFAEEVWWQQTIARAVFEGPFEAFPYGPISIGAPERQKSIQANEEVYPHSLTHAMRTPDHRQDQAIKAVLVPLTEAQKQAYPLSQQQTEELKERFAAVGLGIDGDGRVGPVWAGIQGFQPEF